MRRLTLCCLLLAPLALYAAGPQAQGAQELQDSAVQVQEGPTPLQEAMGIMQRNQRMLRKLVKDPVANRAALSEALGALEGACLSAIANPPTPREPMEEGKQAAWVLGYKIQMTATLDSVLDMHAATLAGDAEAVGAAYGEINMHKKNGHDTYQ